MNIRKNKKGFTLMELVVTTAIMGTLAAVAVPSYLETQTRAKSEKSMANIAELGGEIGKQFNELASSYGQVQLASGATSAAVGAVTDVDVPIVDAGYILVASTSATAFTTATTSNSRTWLDMIPGGIHKSPFGDKDYLMTIVNPGNVTYTADASGNIQPVVTKASILIEDPEEPAFLKAIFSY